jgi:hypothetical protein
LFEVTGVQTCALPIYDIHRRLLNVYGDQTVDVSTVRRWVARFSSGDSDMKDKPRSGRQCTAVTPRNEERLDQLIRANPRITTRGLCTERNIGCNVLEAMVATLEYSKVCARWVPRMLTRQPPLVQIFTSAARRLLFIAGESA